MSPMPMPRLRNISSRTCSSPSIPATHASNIAEPPTLALPIVMPALVAGIHVFFGRAKGKDVDGRDKRGHDSILVGAVSRAPQRPSRFGSRSIRRQELLPLGEEARLAANVRHHLVG